MLQRKLIFIYKKLINLISLHFQTLKDMSKFNIYFKLTCFNKINFFTLDLELLKASPWIKFLISKSILIVLLFFYFVIIPTSFLICLKIFNFSIIFLLDKFLISIKEGLPILSVSKFLLILIIIFYWIFLFLVKLNFINNYNIRMWIFKISKIIKWVFKIIIQIIMGVLYVVFGSVNIVLYLSVILVSHWIIALILWTPIQLFLDSIIYEGKEIFSVFFYFLFLGVLFSIEWWVEPATSFKKKLGAYLEFNIFKPYWKKITTPLFYFINYIFIFICKFICYTTFFIISEFLIELFILLFFLIFFYLGNLNLKYFLLYFTILIVTILIKNNIYINKITTYLKLVNSRVNDYFLLSLNSLYTNRINFILVFKFIFLSILIFINFYTYSIYNFKYLKALSYISLKFLSHIFLIIVFILINLYTLLYFFNSNINFIEVIKEVKNSNLLLKFKGVRIRNFNIFKYTLSSNPIRFLIVCILVFLTIIWYIASIIIYYFFN